MPDLSLPAALRIIETALSGTRSGPNRRIAVCVVDAGGHPLAMLREPDAAPLLAHIAEAKARTCILYGKPTKTVMEWADETPNWFHGVREVALARSGLPLTASKGGVIVRDAEGKVIGAVGVAGEAGEYDQAFAMAGIDSAGFVADAG